MAKPQRNRLYGIVIEIFGWILVVVGLAALVLPGPGLLALFAGVALLATRYEWAERRLEPVRKAALNTARESVSSVPRIVISVLGALLLMAIGVFWGTQPGEPGWWPLSSTLWIPGGWATGGTLIGSGVIALGLVVYSFMNFRD